MAPHSSTLAWKSHVRRGLVGCSPWGRWESDTTERLHFHFSLSCIGEGNGNPLQCSCLENPGDGGAWGAAVSGVAQSRTRLKRLGSGSSRCLTRGLPFSPCALLSAPVGYGGLYLEYLCNLYSVHTWLRWKETQIPLASLGLPLVK